MKTKITTESKNQLIAMFYEGFTSEFLAGHFNISKAMVSLILSEHLDSIDDGITDLEYIAKVERTLFNEIEKEKLTGEKSKLVESLSVEYSNFKVNN